VFVLDVLDPVALADRTEEVALASGSEPLLFGAIGLGLDARVLSKLDAFGPFRGGATLRRNSAKVSS
jgi:hypothetical protein